MQDIRYLEVYADYKLVGLLYDESPLRFEYSDTWLSDNKSKPISPTIPTSKKSHKDIGS